MEFISNHWYIWVIVFVLCFGYVGYSQVSRMKRVMKEPSLDSFFNGAMLVFGVYLIGVGAVILVLISAVIHLIDYAH